MTKKPDRKTTGDVPYTRVGKLIPGFFQDEDPGLRQTLDNMTDEQLDKLLLEIMTLIKTGEVIPALVGPIAPHLKERNRADRPVNVTQETMVTLMANQQRVTDEQFVEMARYLFRVLDVGPDQLAHDAKIDPKTLKRMLDGREAPGSYRDPVSRWLHWYIQHPPMLR